MNINEFPVLLKEWSTRNLVDPSIVRAKALDKYWWECSEGHEWEATPKNRSQYGTGCPLCKRVKKPGNNLSSSYPGIANQWHSTKNKSLQLSPATVGAGSKEKVWWLCDKGHEWQQDIRSRTRKQGKCPYCSNIKLLIGYNDLATTHPELVKEWSSKNTTNPYQTKNGSYWWVCSQGHEWEAEIKNRKAGRGCPYCSNVKLLTGHNDLATTHPYLVEEWHPTKNLSSPSNVKSGKKWWQCSKGHEWEADILSRKTGTSCPYCSNISILIGYNDLETTHPELLIEWSEKNTLSPQQVTYGSEEKAYWKCSEGHEWETQVRVRTMGRNCPSCTSLTSTAEDELAKFIEQLGLNIIRNSRTLIRPLELDIYTPEKKIAVEYNGLYWHSDAVGKSETYHYNKWKACSEQGIQLIQIWEDDWNTKSELIKRMLAHKLGKNKANIIAARKTIFDRISYVEAQVFLEENHIQGATTGTTYMALRDHNNTIVAVMVTLKDRKNNRTEIVRYATSCIIQGGFSKMLRNLEKSLPKGHEITSFSDNSVSDGSLYASNGFLLKATLDPDYKYVYRSKRVHKFNFRLKRFRTDKSLKYQEGLSERELAHLNGIPRIWDCGKVKWSKTIL